MPTLEGAYQRTFEVEGPPVDGPLGSYAGEAAKGTLLTDNVAGALFINTGTVDSPIWTSLGGGIAFDPLSLSPALWLRADAGLFQERTGAAATTPASADGDPVGSWLDQSGALNHATAGTDAARPTLKLAQVNGRSVVRFDGSDDALLTPIGGFGAFPAKRGSVFAVYKRSAATGSGALLSTYPAAAPAAWLWYAVTSGVLDKWYDGSGFHAAAVYDSSAAYTVGAIIRDGDTTVKHYRNGSLADSFTVTDSQQALSPMGVGADTGGGTLHTGDIAEILIFPAALGTTDRQNVEGYLNGRFAIY